MFQHVRRGDPLDKAIKAGDYNAHQDAARAYLNSGLISTDLAGWSNPGLTVAYYSDEPTNEGEAITFDGPWVEPSDDLKEQEFKSNLILRRGYDSTNYIAAGIVIRGTDYSGGEGVYPIGIACVHGIVAGKSSGAGTLNRGDFVKGADTTDSSGLLVKLDANIDSICVGRVIYSDDTDNVLVYVLEPSSCYLGTLDADLNFESTAEATVDGLTGKYVVHDKFLNSGESITSGSEIAIVRDQQIFFAVAAKCP